MTRRLGRWLTSTTALGLLMLGLVAVLAVMVVGGFLGWWPDVFDLLRGTAAGPLGGYTCLPSCDETDGKFLALSSEGPRGFGSASLIVWVTAPEGSESFQLGIFDGDSGKDDGGNLVGGRGGNWDSTTAETKYTLYADPMKDGTGQVVIGEWLGNEQSPNNAWFEIQVENKLVARSPSGVYLYRLEMTQPPEPAGINRLKLRSSGYLSTGKADISEESLSLLGGPQTVDDVHILFTQIVTDPSRNYLSPGPSLYNGDWQFFVYVPDETVTLPLWDGDFDRGTSPSADNDTDDPNTSGRPAWAGPLTVDEQARGRGAQADDMVHPLLKVEPTVRYTLVDPVSGAVYVNQDPSGAQEWEMFSVSTDTGTSPDFLAERLQPGYYNLHIEGLDGGNIVWLRTNFELMPVPVPQPCEATCSSPIGYWQRNVAGVFGFQEGVTQETLESVESALYLTAQYSPLFRKGIDVNAPAPIEALVPLSAEEANTILQRHKQSYPGGSKAAESMMARALQQNLANWLNLMSGKICKDTYVTLTVSGGPFEGLLPEALWEIQELIFNNGDLERASGMGDQINNALRDQDAEVSVCEDYAPVMPPERQKPSSSTLPQAPQIEVAPVYEAQPIACDAPRVNKYAVENPTKDPFYGIQFKFQDGVEVKGSDYDEFRLTVRTRDAALIKSVQMEASAGDARAMVMMEGCQFDGPLPCGEPVMDDSSFFAFYFVGARDHKDGTMTLVFQVQNYTADALSEVVIGLPDGVEASAPQETYESEVCP